MTTTHDNPIARTAVLLALAASACLGVGCSRGIAASSSDLLDEPALAQVGLADVESASSSCEDLLGGVIDFALLGETGLVVGLDAAGEAVCIDTVEAVNGELAETGRPTDAVALLARYEHAMDGREDAATFRRRAYGGDPDPEPNSPQFTPDGMPVPGI